MRLYFAEGMESGMVHVNDSSVYDEPYCPFGGCKQSGVGREGGRHSMEEMSENQVGDHTAGTTPLSVLGGGCVTQQLPRPPRYRSSAVDRGFGLALHSSPQESPWTARGSTTFHGTLIQEYVWFPQATRSVR